MLTSLYYYNHYRPYMVGEARDGKFVKPQSKVRKDDILKEYKKSGDDFNVQLNKSLKNDIVNHARDVYKNVVGLKTATKSLVSDMKLIEGYNKKKKGEYYEDESFEELVGYMYEDLAGFVSSYNEASEFLSKESMDDKTKEIVSDIKKLYEDNKNTLKNLGLKERKDGSLFISKKGKEQIEGKNPGEIQSIVGDERPFFSGVFEKLDELLKKPMAEHMNFKSLKLFYNYEYDKKQHDTLKLIRSGMLVDVAL